MGQDEPPSGAVPAGACLGSGPLATHFPPGAPPALMALALWCGKSPGALLAAAFAGVVTLHTCPWGGSPAQKSPYTKGTLTRETVTEEHRSHCKGPEEGLAEQQGPRQGRAKLLFPRTAPGCAAQSPLWGQVCFHQNWEQQRMKFPKTTVKDC